MVLGDHVEDLRQGTVSDETKPLLYANHMPKAIEVWRQRPRVRASCKARISRKIMEFVCRSSAALVGLQDPDRCAREVALIGVLVEENSAMELDGNVEVLRQRVVGDDHGALPHADNVPWAVEVACQRARVQSPRPGEELQLFSQPPVGLIRTKGRPTRTTK